MMQAIKEKGNTSMINKVKQLKVVASTNNTVKSKGDNEWLTCK